MFSPYFQTFVNAFSKCVGTPDRIVMHKPHCCKCCGRPLDGIGYSKIRKTQIMDIRFVMETTEEQYYEKVCECGAVNNCDAPTAASSTETISELW